MAATTAVAAILGTAIAGASTGYQINAAEEAKQKAAEQAAEQKIAQDKLLADQKQQKAIMAESEAAVVKRNLDIARQKDQQAASSGRAGTILTSPLGIPGSAPLISGKTLLGS